MKPSEVIPKILSQGCSNPTLFQIIRNGKPGLETLSLFNLALGPASRRVGQARCKPRATLDATAAAASPHRRTPSPRLATARCAQAWNSRTPSRRRQSVAAR